MHRGGVSERAGEERERASPDGPAAHVVLGGLVSDLEVSKSVQQKNKSWNEKGKRRKNRTGTNDKDWTNNVVMITQDLTRGYE